MNPITMHKLVTAVALKIKMCLEVSFLVVCQAIAVNIVTTKDLRHAASAESKPDWWAANYPPERLVLLELRHVSAGSWQPVLCALP